MLEFGEITVDIPFSLKVSAEGLFRDVWFLSALMWYRKNKLSLGKAAKLAGYSKLEFIRRMKLEGKAIFDYQDERDGGRLRGCGYIAMRVV